MLGGRPHQKERQRDDVRVTGKALLDAQVPGGRITDAGLHSDVSVALQYLEAWLRGSGAVAINNMMEDTATAEIARAQLWQWIRHGVKTEEGAPVTLDRVRRLLREEVARLERRSGWGEPARGGRGAAGKPGGGEGIPGVPDAGGVREAELRVGGER